MTFEIAWAPEGTHLKGSVTLRDVRVTGVHPILFFDIGPKNNGYGLTAWGINLNGKDFAHQSQHDDVLKAQNRASILMLGIYRDFLQDRLCVLDDERSSLFVRLEQITSAMSTLCK